MELTFLNITIFNLISHAIYQIVYLWLVCMLLGIKRVWKKILTITVSISIFVAPIAALIYVTGLFRSNYFIGQILIEFLIVTLNICLIFWCMERDLKKVIVIAGISEFIISNVSSFSGIIITSVLDLTIKPEFLLYTFVEYGLFPLLSIPVLYLLRKIRLPVILGDLITSVKGLKRGILLCSVSLLLPVLHYFVIFLIENLQDYFSTIYSFTSMILIVLVLGLIRYVSSSERNKEKLKTQKTLLMQQQIYVQNMEEMQLEMRIFRHDYKNMIAGMYLQAKEGQLEKLQNTIQKMTMDFDLKVEKNIKQTTQLSNMQIIEIKSLLLSKLIEMQKKGIKCNLEILYPVKTLAIPIDDANRCLGILIDNAMEEAESQENSQIDIIISKQIECVTILVMNTFVKEIDLHNIWKAGYSTKGVNRGLGLYSYLKILEKYDNVMPITSCKEDKFIQELKIKEI